MRPAQGTQNRPFRDQEPAPPCPGIRSQKETEIDDPTYTLQPVANRNGTHRQRCVAPSGPGNLTAPTGYNGLPCDLSRVDRAGTVKPANRGAREVPKHNVTMTTQRTLHSLPEGEPLKTQTWITQKCQGQDVSVQSDRKNTPAGSPEELTKPLPCSEEPERHPRKGDNWTGTPEPNALREKRKSPGEREPWHFRTSTSRIANHPEKVETDKSTRRQG